nr:hypothetical protein [Gammaproteobacteria bacterium]
MVQQLRHKWRVYLLFGIGLVSALSGQAAEKKSISGQDRYVRTLSQTVSHPDDTSHHFLVQQVMIHETKSADSDFNNLTVRVYEQADSVRDKGTHRGYRIQCHENGDKTYVKYYGVHKLSKGEQKPHKVDIEGHWQLTGGTGKFSGIKGGGRYSGRETLEDLTLEWEGEVEY